MKGKYQLPVTVRGPCDTEIQKRFSLWGTQGVSPPWAAEPKASQNGNSNHTFKTEKDKGKSKRESRGLVSRSPPPFLSSEAVTHRIQAFFLQFGLLQVVTPLGHAEQPPALADLLVNLGLREVRELLLHFQVDVVIVQKVRRPEEARASFRVSLSQPLSATCYGLLAKTLIQEPASCFKTLPKQGLHSQ